MFNREARLPPAALAGGALAAAAAAARVVYAVASRGPDGLFNDFYDYWGAAVLLDRGRDPYDVSALNQVQHSAGIAATTGSGYSYPILWAELLRPLAHLRPEAAALAFSALSLIALAVAIALLLASIDRLDWPTGILGGIAAGLFPPVIGSLYFGQANLLLLLLLALAYRMLLPEPLLALAGAIKLYPIAGLLESLARRRLRWSVVGVALFAVLILLPQLFSPGRLSDRTGYFLSPDTYWSNESVNGFLSRLAIPSTWTRPPLPWLPAEGLMLVLTACLALGVLLVLVRSGGRPWTGCLALTLWLGAVTAPKNSLWNFTPLLLCVAYAWPLVRRRPPLLLLGALGWLLIEAQVQLDTARETVYRADPWLAWLSSLGLYGALLIGGLTAYLVLRQARLQPAATPPGRLLPPSPSPDTRGTVPASAGSETRARAGR
jgi:hypothetical protein